MRILIVHCVYKYKGGEDTVVAEEMKLLKGNGIDVQLLEFNNFKNPFLKILQLPFNIASYLQTKKKLEDYKPAIVHIHNFHFGASPSVIYAIKKSKTPIVITLHNYRLLCPSAMLFYKGKPFLNSLHQAFPWSAVVRGVYKNSILLTFWLSLSNQFHRYIGTWKLVNRFIVLTQISRKIFSESTLAIPLDKIVIKPNFCKVSSITCAENLDDFLYVGRLSEEKGITLLLEAFSVTNYKIKIAGEGPLRDLVISYSAKFSNIEYLGILNKQAIFSFLKSCSALVFPSIWYEGMPLTIIEAFASGTPVIASKIGAMEGMVTHKFNGLHFEPNNKEDLLDKLDYWQNLNDEERYKYKENSLKSFNDSYTAEKNFDEMLAIYQSVLKGAKKGYLSLAV